MKVFASKAPKIFELPLDFTSDSTVDAVRQQWKMYQLEHITESIYMVENETRKIISPILTGIMTLNIQDYFKRGLWKKVDI